MRPRDTDVPGGTESALGVAVAVTHALAVRDPRQQRPQLVHHEGLRLVDASIPPACHAVLPDVSVSHQPPENGCFPDADGDRARCPRRSGRADAMGMPETTRRHEFRGLDNGCAGGARARPGHRVHPAAMGGYAARGAGVPALRAALHRFRTQFDPRVREPWQVGGAAELPMRIADFPGGRTPGDPDPCDRRPSAGCVSSPDRHRPDSPPPRRARSTASRTGRSSSEQRRRCCPQDSRYRRDPALCMR